MELHSLSVGGPPDAREKTGERMTESEGAAGYHALCTSRALASACYDPRTVEAKEAMRLFLPPVPQDMVQIQRPLPEPYQAWCRGFERARADVFEWAEQLAADSVALGESEYGPSYTQRRNDE